MAEKELFGISEQLDTISRQVAIDELDKLDGMDGLRDHFMVRRKCVYKMLKELPSAQPECEDAVPRTSVEYICRKNTVSTNPYEHEHHEKFIKFMDDPEIADFGRWQHSNGFNTALVAVKCDLDKVPPAQQKKLKYSGESICIHCQIKVCDGCLFEPMEGR